MPKVVLITTGKAEFCGLPAALGRLFPDVDFIPEGPVDSFTTARVVPLPTDRKIEANVDKLAARLVAAVNPGRKTKSQERADLAFVIEDLELVNVDQPQVVVDTLRSAVQRHVDKLPWNLKRKEETHERLRERGSFHLFMPMLETYFFGDPAALQRAGTKQTPKLAAGVDLEAFEAIDSLFLSEPGAHAKHPKRYLAHLCQRDGNQYREAHQGAAALRDLDWSQVLAALLHVQFLRALIHDLADGLGVPPPFAGNCSPITFRLGHPNNTLRNL